MFGRRGVDWRFSFIFRFLAGGSVTGRASVMFLEKSGPSDPTEWLDSPVVSSVSVVFFGMLAFAFALAARRPDRDFFAPLVLGVRAALGALSVPFATFSFVVLSWLSSNTKSRYL